MFGFENCSSNFGHNNLSNLFSNYDVEFNSLHMISAVTFLSEFSGFFIRDAVFCLSKHRGQELSRTDDSEDSEDQSYLLQEFRPPALAQQAE
jgi:hypothetical protein